MSASRPLRRCQIKIDVPGPEPSFVPSAGDDWSQPKPDFEPAFEFLRCGPSKLPFSAPACLFDLIDCSCDSAGLLVRFIPEDQEMLGGTMIAHGADDRAIGIQVCKTLRSFSD